MKQPWLKTALPIALIFSFRMLGLFMLIPVFTLYAPTLSFSTPTLTGIALGVYGLSQGLLQIPFGLWSDQFGRKPLIALGLGLFILGSILGALTHSIYGMIIARILQGSGAIGSVLIALLADLTETQERTKSMAIVGMTIGLSFGLAMILSPVITTQFGLSGIFYFTIVLGLMGLVILYKKIPTPPPPIHHDDTEPSVQLLKTVLRNTPLLRLDFGIFTQHLILTASFFVIPILLKDALSQQLIHSTWPIYLAWIGLGFIFMVPLIVLAEKKGLMAPLFKIMVGLTTLTQLILLFGHHSFWWLYLCMQIYFVGFNFLEAALPSIISKIAPPQMKGTAMGVYSTAQFLGIFVGGSFAGLIYGHWQTEGIFLMNTLFGLAWLITSLSERSHPLWNKR